MTLEKSIVECHLKMRIKFIRHFLSPETAIYSKGITVMLFGPQNRFMFPSYLSHHRDRPPRTETTKEVNQPPFKMDDWPDNACLASPIHGPSISYLCSCGENSPIWVSPHPPPPPIAHFLTHKTAAQKPYQKPVDVSVWVCPSAIEDHMPNLIALRVLPPFLCHLPACLLSNEIYVIGTDGLLGD